MSARLMKELKKMEEEQADIKFKMDPSNVHKILFLLKGPTGTPYEKGFFKIETEFENYPFKAPKVRFLTKVFHPNVKTESGELC